MRKLLLLTVLLVVIYGCTKSVEGVYTASNNTYHKLIIEKTGNYYYKISGETVNKGRWKEIDGEIVFYNWESQGVCRDSYDGKVTLMVRHIRGEIIFSEDIPRCNFELE